MNQNDIEDILEQYSEDKRQQQQLSASLRHLARKQARLRAGIFGAIAALVCIVAAVKLMSPSQHAAPMLASTSQTHTTVTDTTFHTVTDSIIQQPENILRRHSTHRHNAKTDIVHKQTETELLADKSQPGTDLMANTFDNAKTTPHSDTVAEPIPFPTTELIAEQILANGFEDNNPNVLIAPSQQSSRIKLITSISASAASNMAAGYAADIEVTDAFTNSDGGSFATIDPRFSLSANIGAAYTVTSSLAYKLDIGLSLSGHTQQGVVNKYIASSENSSNFVNNDNTVTILDDGNYTYNAFSLFANFPIQMNFFPSGSDKTGWSLSLTPAHSIARTRPLGAFKNNPYEINPWKLTLGVGIVIPRRFIHHIGLTANLLPIYNSKSVHEIGIEIGF